MVQLIDTRKNNLLEKDRKGSKALTKVKGKNREGSKRVKKELRRIETSQKRIECNRKIISFTILKLGIKHHFRDFEMTF